MNKNNEKFSILIKENIRLLKINFITLLIFESIYTFIGTVLIFPFSLFVIKHTINFIGYPYLNGNNFIEIIKSPLFIVLILILIIIFAAYILFELTTLIFLFNESYFNRKVQVLPLCKKSLNSAITIIKPQNILLIIFVLVIIPFTNLSFSSSFISEIPIPEFIMSHITSTPYLAIIYGSLNIILGLIVILWIFCLHYFTLNHFNFLKATNKSFHLLKEHFWSTIFLLLVWNSLLILVLLIALFLGELLLIFVISGLINHTIILSIVIGFFGILISIIFTFFKLVNTPLNFALISTLFYSYSKKSSLEIIDEPIIIQSKEKKIKKSWIVSLIIIILLITVAVSSYNIFTSFETIFSTNFFVGPEVSGHRGNSEEAPENTLIAIEKAIELGADYAEIDVAQTKDGVIVVSHDNNLKRVSGHNVNIWSSNYDDIKNFDIGSWFDPKYSDQHLPTLDEVIKLANGRIKLNIELKPTGHEENLVSATMAVINNNHFKNNCFLASLSYPALLEIEKIDPTFRTAYITAIAMGDIYLMPVDIFSIESNFVTPKLVDSIHKAKKEIHVWTVDNETTMKTMVEFEVDNIITDDIAITKATIEEMHQPADLVDQIYNFLLHDILK
jgi:glycerophosphoryl diester phosphodiesterase